MAESEKATLDKLGEGVIALSWLGTQGLPRFLAWSLEISKGLVGAGRFERPTTCAQDGSWGILNSPRFELLTLQEGITARRALTIDPRDAFVSPLRSITAPTAPTAFRNSARVANPGTR